jgi:putative flippase GtrA
MSGTGWVTRERLLEIVRFGVVGGGTFALDEGCLILLRTSTGMPLGIDTALAYAVAALVNFVASRQWVFEQASSGARPRTALVRYIIVVVIGLLITAALVPALQAAGIDYRIGKVIVSGLVGIANYFAFPMWVFKGTEAADAPSAAASTDTANTEVSADTADAPETSDVG